MGTKADPGAVEESAADLARRLGLSFTNLRWLVRAFTHRSYANEHPEALEDNERLEFLGDAVLDFVVGAWVYNRFPEMSEGEMTRIRSALVRTDTLAEFARRLDLGRALRLGRGETSTGGRNRDNLLCAVFEALIGAIYIDGGIPAAEAFVVPLLQAIPQADLLKDDIYDPKSRLQEWAQANRRAAPHYVTVAASGPDHAKTFTVEVRIEGQPCGRGSGTSKRVAAQVAARDALETLGLD